MWRLVFVLTGLLTSAALVLAPAPHPRARADGATASADLGRAPSSAASVQLGRLAPADASRAVSLGEGLLPNPWPLIDAPTPGPARALGAYASGCLQGARALPLDGPGYQVMRPSRRAYYGHPDLVEYVRALGAEVHAQGLGVLLVGDMSLPRGGRTQGGHSSHQTGLDVDVWFWQPREALSGPLSDAQREELEAPSILDEASQTVRAPWQALVANVLRIAALAPRVDRIFVHPGIKRDLCAVQRVDEAWLRKIRPWHGHNDHFHVRLACPQGDNACKGQAPLPPGNGCDQLGFWFSPAAQAARDRARSAYARHVREPRRWPQRCDRLL